MSESRLGPRVVIAGTHSGVGKTTIATGIMAALRHRGVRVGSAKVGPDFIDPGYHALATGRPGRNLDPWICGADAIGPLAGRAALECELLVVEGVMGLFDGAADRSPSSTADVARLLDAPVVLVVDASAMSDSVAALVHGFATFAPDVAVRGVVMNRVGSPGHETMLRAALDPLGIPVLGVVPRDDELAWRDRHLGLVPVIEQRPEVERALVRLARVISSSCSLDAVVDLARSASDCRVAPVALPARVGAARVAVAAGPAFSFCYEDNLEALAAAGAELIPFDPCAAPALPEGCTGLVAGGGFPEVFSEALAANTPLLDDVASRVRAGVAVWAECGGLLWLARRLDGFAMAGVVETDAVMTGRLTLGYRTATTAAPSPLGAAGVRLRGHEYHYSSTSPAGGALTIDGREGSSSGGFATPSMLASYLHLHLGGAPELAAAFVAAATASRP